MQNFRRKACIIILIRIVIIDIFTISGNVFSVLIGYKIFVIGYVETINTTIRLVNLYMHVIGYASKA